MEQTEETEIIEPEIDGVNFHEVWHHRNYYIDIEDWNYLVTKLKKIPKEQRIMFCKNKLQELQDYCSVQIKACDTDAQGSWCAEQLDEDSKVFKYYIKYCQ
jgi:hypothetical protein